MKNTVQRPTRLVSTIMDRNGPSGPREDQGECRGGEHLQIERLWLTLLGGPGKVFHECGGLAPGKAKDLFTQLSSEEPIKSGWASARDQPVGRSGERRRDPRSVSGRIEAYEADLPPAVADAATGRGARWRSGTWIDAFGGRPGASARSARTSSSAWRRRGKTSSAVYLKKCSP